MKTAGNSLTVFLVDDDVLFLTALKHNLHEKFRSLIKIHTFSNAEEFLCHMQEKPDLVVLDYSLDGIDGKSMNGIEVLYRIKKASEDTDVVILSGQRKTEVVEESLHGGASKYVVKGRKAAVAIQNKVNVMLHEHREEQDRRENTRLNVFVLVIFSAFAASLVFFYLKFR